MLDLQAAEQLIEVATAFYVRGRTQVQIARDLDLDPSTVSRYLKRAREEGIVHIEIRPPRQHDVDLGRRLAATFGLDRALVVPTTYEPGLDVALPAVAAEFVDGILSNGARIGISWGRTLADLVRNLRPGAVTGLEVAQLAGGVSDPTPGIHGSEVARQLAGLYPDSHVHYLHAPAIVDTPAIRDALLADRSVAAALEAGATSEISIVGIGSMGPHATLVKGGHLQPADRDRLIAAGAIGNMNVRFFDAAGRPVTALDSRTVGVGLEELRSQTVIAVGAGTRKVGAIFGALRTGVVRILVTDVPTAQALIAIAPDQSYST